jgi:hypothetical protein
MEKMIATWFGQYAERTYQRWEDLLPEQSHARARATADTGRLTWNRCV